MSEPRWKVIYEDPHLVIVNKPFGLPSQSTRAGEPGLFESLQEHYAYVGLHHRLDQTASGLILFSRRREINRPVSQLFLNHQIQRSYACVLVGHAQAEVWSAPIQGKAAKSRVRPLGTGQGLTAAMVTLQTGRKHQIRVHAALAGTPIAGDHRYGGEAARRSPRLALHAHQLALPHPETGEVLTVVSPIPEDLTALWHAAGGPPSLGDCA